MFDLRYMEIENSGLVITFKKKHPITAKEPVFPILEFSVDLLEDFQVREYTIYFDVCSIRGSAGQIRRLKIELKGFSGHQLDEIIKSLVDRKQ